MALRLVGLEGRDEDGGRTAPAVHRAIERLGRHLTPLVGVTGFEALLARSRALASAGAEGLEGAAIAPDRPASRPPDPAGGAEAALLAHLLGLLMSYIGQDLTFRLAARAWSVPSLHEAVPDGEGSSS